MLHGCTIGNNSLIGIGSTILNGAVIAENCMVGAHALITENKTFPPGSLIIGAPARVARQLSAEEIASIGAAAEHYVDNATRFCETLKAID
jgi:carbonic anhydrase/acetyltransferase-like protein (isoleucine patch superfamily)